jgi:5-methylcytosine-specific restriction endonuclease McrA
VRRVLLLNITYEPLTTVGLHRAVCLVLGDKAEIVHEDAHGAVLHSASSRLAAPSVIKLCRYVRVPYRSRIPLTRAALMRRDNYLCAYCGVKADSIDHVIPRSRGGTHDWSNVVAACKRDNLVKADLLLSELGWTLRVKPAPPDGYLWRLRHLSDMDPLWEPYLAAAS